MHLPAEAAHQGHAEQWTQRTSRPRSRTPQETYGRPDLPNTNILRSRRQRRHGRPGPAGAVRQSVLQPPGHSLRSSLILRMSRTMLPMPSWEWCPTRGCLEVAQVEPHRCRVCKSCGAFMSSDPGTPTLGRLRLGRDAAQRPTAPPHPPERGTWKSAFASSSSRPRRPCPPRVEPVLEDLTDGPLVLGCRSAASGSRH